MSTPDHGSNTAELVADEQPVRRRWRFGLRALLIAYIGAALLLGCWALRLRERELTLRAIRSRTESPLTLHVVYVEDPALADPTIDLHQGNAQYVFRNRLPVSVKIAFPPISYVPGPGMLSFHQSSDPQQMPGFCFQPRLVEIPGNGEVSFESPYQYLGSRQPEPRFIFGNPAGVSDDKVLICPVVGTSEWQKKGEAKP